MNEEKADKIRKDKPMINIRDEPAFPVPEFMYREDFSGPPTFIGMSTRTWMMGMVVSGIIRDNTADVDDDEPFDINVAAKEIAEHALAITEAALDALEAPRARKSDEH